MNLHYSPRYYIVSEFLPSDIMLTYGFYGKLYASGK